VNFLLRTIIVMVAILIVSYLFPGILKTEGFLAAFVGAFILGLANAVVRPFLVILTLPVTVLTLGLFLLVVNALMVMLTAWLVPGFDVGGFWAAILASVMISVISAILSMVAR
jgi:putative membrane protein